MKCKECPYLTERSYGEYHTVYGCDVLWCEFGDFYGYDKDSPDRLNTFNDRICSISEYDIKKYYEKLKIDYKEQKKEFDEFVKGIHNEM